MVASGSLQGYYVKPSGFTAGCPGEPCLTLDQYVIQQSEYFTTMSTFIFLTGNHSLHATLKLVNISDLILVGDSGSGVTVLCKTVVAIHCENVTELTIENMKLIFERPVVDRGTFALSIIHSTNILFLNVQFQGNPDINSTRGIFVNDSDATVKKCIFKGNSGSNGGAIFASDGSNLTLMGNLFIGNRAQNMGGAIFANNSFLHFKGIVFIQNSAHFGGALFLLYSELDSTVDSVTEVPDSGVPQYECLENFGSTTQPESTRECAICFFNNTAAVAGGALMAQVSSLSFSGYTLFQENFAEQEGGAVTGLYRASFLFTGVTLFIGNKATTEGGAAILGAIESEFNISGYALFRRNNCTTCYGGAASLSGESRMTLSDNITFEHNWAEMGGALYIRDSTVVLKQHSTLVTSHNHARYFGGAIFHMDNINSFQCEFVMGQLSLVLALITLPGCFLRLDEFDFSGNAPYDVFSYNDTAGFDGQFLYGGLMDKCIVLDSYKVEGNLLYKVVTSYNIFHIKADYGNNGTNAISSEAYALCLCVNDKVYYCGQNVQSKPYRGSQFNVSVLALSQGNTITAPVLLAKISKTARLELNQDSQNLTSNCTTISYNIYSTEDQENLTLYLDKSCRDTGLAEMVVTVEFERCPPAFEISGDQCVCEERLQKYNAKCVIYNNDNNITRRAGSRFWMGAQFLEETYEGLILYPSCPTDYCQTEEVNFSLSHLDSQCGFNHSGLLCGSCAANHSLMLGNSKCQECTNLHLLLTLAFAGAGIALVVFLSFLRLTVATGMINSVILYANIVQANRSFFFPDSAKVNVLTVFIAWMNLDLGFPTCFYDGMDAYAHTWLQFAFPVYVWVLISVIIITSRYSTLATKLIGSNPIAVLATLLLMSYAKVLRNIIEIYASVHLRYPNRNVTVWLKDANVPYLRTHHLQLAVVCSVFVGMFFLPYTVLLLLGYKLYRFSRNRYLRWFMMKMKPLLDSYYAPYQKHTRYWTGLLLLVRCALYIVFSFDSIGGTDNSLLAIIAVFTILIAIAWLSVRVYKSFYVNAIEAVMYLNVIGLAAATSNKANSPSLVYVLVGMAFAIMLGIILHHFHLLYIAKSAVWLKVTTKLASFMQKNKLAKAKAEQSPLIPPLDTAIVSKSVVDLREPLLEEIDS